ncbi:MAG: EamA family transporter [Pseudomonadota bacterium]|nr:EamA family transporter [Pseudomonadota bacterium]MEC8664650.1 EamA family transporter [Pseudomonadota bacterium]
MNFKDIALALLVIVIWAGNIIAIKYAVMELPPLTAITLRFGLTALAFLPFARWPGKDLAKHLLIIAIFMGFLHQGLLFLGMAQLSAGLSAIFLQSQVIFSTILGVIFFKEVIGWRSIAGLIMGILGICFIYGDSTAGFSATGFWMLMASTLALAYAYMMMKKLPPVKPATFLCLMNGLAFPFVLIAAALMERDQWSTVPNADWTLLTEVFIYQIFLVGLSHIIWQKLLTRNDMGLVTPFTLLLPICGVSMAVLFLDEVVSMRMIIGGSIAILGVGIIVLRRAQKKTSLPRCPAGD